MIAWMTFNAMLYGVLLVQSVRVAHRTRSRRVRAMSVVASAASAVAALASVQRIGLQLVRAGEFSAELFATLTGWFQVLLVITGSAVGLWALFGFRRLTSEVEGAERMVTVLTEQAALDVAAVSEWGLTARELEVVELLASGRTSDAAIADALFIAEATAATHVKNILRKAGLSNRMQLMLMAHVPRTGEG